MSGGGTANQTSRAKGNPPARDLQIVETMPRPVIKAVFNTVRKSSSDIQGEGLAINDERRVAEAFGGGEGLG